MREMYLSDRYFVSVGDGQTKNTIKSLLFFVFKRFTSLMCDFRNNRLYRVLIVQCAFKTCQSNYSVRLR